MVVLAQLKTRRKIDMKSVLHYSTKTFLLKKIHHSALIHKIIGTPQTSVTKENIYSQFCSFTLSLSSTTFTPGTPCTTLNA